MQLTIEVTAQHILLGTPMSATDDPIALALREMVGPGPTIFVEDTGIRLIDSGAGSPSGRPEQNDTVHGDLPRSAREFIEAYDNGHTVHPFTFTVEFSEVL